MTIPGALSRGYAHTPDQMGRVSAPSPWLAAKNVQVPIPGPGPGAAHVAICTGKDSQCLLKETLRRVSAHPGVWPLLPQPGFGEPELGAVVTVVQVGWGCLQTPGA